jgi:hypothetical protein
MGNLGVELTLGVQDGLNTGYPVIRTAVSDIDYSHSPGGRGAMARDWTGGFTGVIQIIRNLVAPEGSIVPEIYADRQKAACRSDMRVVMSALKGMTPNLPINGGATVQSMSRPIIHSDPIPVNNTTVVFMCSAEISFIGRGTTF